MKFEEFFISLIQFNRLNMNDLYSFLAEYCNLCGKDFTSEQITALCNLVQMGQLNLDYAIRNYCKLSKLIIYIVKDLQSNQIIKMYLKNER